MRRLEGMNFGYGLEVCRDTPTFGILMRGEFSLHVSLTVYFELCICLCRGDAYGHSRVIVRYPAFTRGLFYIYGNFFIL